MKSVLTATFLMLAMSTPSFADNRGKLIFSDDFERNESVETTEEVGNGWATNSKKRAAGNKQVDLRDGAMYIYIHKAADHGVSVTHPLGIRDGSVELRFKLDDAKDSIGLNFADLKYKAVHAGHICMARIHAKHVQLFDLKTGNMDKKIREARQAKKLTDEQKKLIASKSKKFNHKLSIGNWHKLIVTIKGDTISASIDGKAVGSFSSEGIAHPTKRTLRLAVPKNAWVDDVKFYSLGKAAASK